MEQKTYTIYVHINKLNNKCYVGQTCRAVAKRWKNGAGYLDGSQPKFENAIKKYGWANFEHKIIYTNLTLEEANKLEKELGIEVIMEDERLTSVISNNVLIQASMSRKKRKKKVDGMASVIILQSYLDRKVK